MAKMLPTAEDFTNCALRAYDMAVNGLQVAGSARELAESYKTSGESVHASVDSLIRWQCSKTMAAGFITGLPGLIAMPITIPADVSQSIYVQLRMNAAIAHLYGKDIYDDKVKTLALACLCGKGATDVLRKAGVAVVQKVAMSVIKAISKETIRAINKAVGFKLLTKFGTKGVVSLAKIVPVLGGVAGGAVNGFSTYVVGKTAKNILGSA